MTISARVILDSVSPEGIRLAAVQLRYPLVIHAEFLTHRTISRNSRSSRAVPIEKMIQDVIDDPFIPVHWGKAQPGMQAHEQCSELVADPWRNDPLLGEAYMSSEDAWLLARDNAVSMARSFQKSGYHKQVVNRLLAPFLHIDTLASATDWANFFALRDHHAAEPHIQALAREMKKALEASEPVQRYPDDRIENWHLPYVDYDADKLEICRWMSNRAGSYQGDGSYEDVKLHLIKLSAARCARISYEPFDGDARIESELRRYDLLVGSQPIHASPCEHQALPDMVHHWSGGPKWAHPEQHGNLSGWRQWRKFIPGEFVKDEVTPWLFD